MAVLVFELILQAAGPEEVTQFAAVAVLRTVLIGGVLGVGAGLVLSRLIQAYWIADYLQNAVSIMFVVVVYAAAQHFQSESGLFAATVMGVTLANQKFADIRHIVEFKENLRVLLISGLFIVLAARLELDDFANIGWAAELGFLAVLVIVARPLAVLCSTVGATLARRERIFLGWMAPRGIVAAAVSSVFALRLLEEGVAGAERIVPLTFLAIVGTVLLYGLTGPAVARRLGVADPDPQGVLLVGASAWARSAGELLSRLGFRVLLVDTNRAHLAAARMADLPVYTGSILGEHALDELDLGGIGKLIAATPNDWVNVLAVQRFARVFGSGEVYQLVAGEMDERTAVAHEHLHGRRLFGRDVTYADLATRLTRSWVVKATPITEEFTYEDFQGHYGDNALSLFVVTQAKKLLVSTDEQPITPEAGQTLISLVLEEGR
ncbi:MAG: cation:proton antiporter domain-containing protein [Planctomycetota bacterium]